MKEFDNLHECTCSIRTGWEEIINRGWIGKIPQLQSSTTTTTTTSVDNNFCTKLSSLYRKFFFSFQIENDGESTTMILSY